MISHPPPLPSLQSVSGLLQLDISNNAFTGRLPPLPFPNLTFIDISNHKDLGDVSSLAELTSLQSLFGHNIGLDSFPQLSPSVTTVDLAGNRLVTVNVSDHDNLQDLSLQGNQLSGVLTFTGLPALQTLDVSSNNLQGLVLNLETPLLARINASYNPHLNFFTVNGTAVNGLDISYTSIPFASMTPNMGIYRLLVKSMLDKSWSVSTALEPLLYEPLLQLLDISGMHDLDNLAALEQATSRYFSLDPPPNNSRVFIEEILAHNRYTSVQYYPVVQLPMLVVTNSPTTCALQTNSNFTYSLEGSLREFQGVLPSARYFCRCIPGYHAAKRRCVPNVPWIQTSAGIALVTTICLLTVLLIAVYVRRRWRTGFTRLRGELALHQHLLGDAEDEVQALRQAWEIPADALRLERCIDRGTFGAVYEAWWQDQEKVAVKVLHSDMLELDRSIAEDFAKEAEFLMKWRHANLVRFFGAGQMPAGSPFVVLELVTRGSLRNLIKKRRHLVPSVKLQLAADVARGMAFIHSIGTLHRDLKSGNVLVTEQWRAKVADLGSVRSLLIKKNERHRQSFLGRAASVFQTQSGEQPSGTMSLTVGVGTPWYMAPEVLDSQPYGKGADVWSYGVVVWEMWTGRDPDLVAELGEEPESFLTIQMAQLLAEGRHLPVDPAAPTWVRSIWDQCFVQNPKLRVSFEELEQQLAAAAETDRLLTEGSTASDPDGL